MRLLLTRTETTWIYTPASESVTPHGVVPPTVACVASRRMTAIFKPLVAGAAILFVMAAAPSEVAPIIDVQGYFIEEGSGATDASISRSVSDARTAGGALSVVVLADEPPGGATTYSGAVLTELAVSSGTVLTVAPETIGVESVDDIWSIEEIDVALDLALEGGTADEIVSLFVEGLTNPPSSGGGGLMVLLIIAAVIGGIVFLIWRSGRAAKEAKASALTAAKAGVQSQIDAIANDILELEDEIAEAGAGEASDYFHEAAGSFASAAERLLAASDPQTVVDLGFDLDVTIWKLDCAEALLDGNLLPHEPIKPVPAPEPAPVRTPEGISDVPRSLPDSLPEYDRRAQRQSSYGSNDLMQTLLAAAAMSGVGGSRRGVGRRRGSSRPRSGSMGTRIRSGRRRR
jgi:hypothetical protein